MIKKNNLGITLISLVITIIVLLILAGVTLSLILGENGLLKRATDATEEYSKAEAEEKVKLLLSEYIIDKTSDENDNFANFLRKNLQVGVAENADNTCSFMLGEWQVITDENRVIRIEKFKLDVDKIYPNVASMRADTGLTAGKLIQTESYYDKQYGGSAYYDIVNSTILNPDGAKCIQLDNGLYAELHPINDTITVNQFGAYGDGEHDDAINIQLALNAGYRNVAFESERYKFGIRICVSTGNLSIIGNNATLFWNEEIAFDTWEQFYIMGQQNSHVKNIDILNLNFENGDLKVNNGTETVQLLMLYCDEVYVSNCKFNIYEIDGNKDRKITNIWIYDEFGGITIENCSFVNLTNGNVGGNIWISGSERNNDYISGNVTIRNNYIEKSCHDESIGVWRGTIEDINIDNNEFNIHEEKVDNPSYMNFTFGSDIGDGIVRNISFTNNKVKAQSTGQLIACNGNNGSENILIQSNIMEWTKLGNDISYSGMFRNLNTNNIRIIKNKIKYENIGNGYLSILALNCELLQNELEINGDIYSLATLANNTKFTGNTININGDINFLFEGTEFKENNVSINGNLAKLQDNTSIMLFRLFNSDLMEDVKINNNRIEINSKEEWNSIANAFSIYKSKLNNHNVEFSNNLITSSTQTSSNYLIRVQDLTDTTEQTILANGNNSNIFKVIYFNSNNINPVVIVNDKKINTTTTLE